MQTTRYVHEWKIVSLSEKVKKCNSTRMKNFTTICVHLLLQIVFPTVS